MKQFGACFLALLFAACGPSDQGDNAGGGADAGATTCEPTAETEISCGNGQDDDCDGRIDCEDIDCSFDAICTGEEVDDECGQATYGGDPLAIPDGSGEVYQTSISISGFEDGQKLQSADGFVKACVNMEHSWLRDLQIEMVCPSGTTVVLQQFLGQEGSELYMGEPNDSDGIDPTPGVGAEYCWAADAPNQPMLDYANANPDIDVLPPGSYQPNGSFGDLVGCDLNGDWTIRVIDDWGIDNGYIFEWTVSFSPSIIPDCDDWID